MQDADRKGTLESPGDEQEEQENEDDGEEIAPVSEELGDVPDARVLMGGYPDDDGFVDEEGDGAEEEEEKIRNSKFEIRK